MKWFDEAEEDMVIFFSAPSPFNCPDCIPASWIAACILSHPIHKFFFRWVDHEDGECTFEFRKLNRLLHLSDNLPHQPLLHCKCCHFFLWQRNRFQFALRTLPADSEISLTYGRTFTNSDIDERQSPLSEMYFFKYDYEAGRNKWDNLAIMHIPILRL